MADLEMILNELSDPNVVVRERAMSDLLPYAHRADGEAENDSLEEWGKGLVRRTRDSRVVKALLTAMDDSSARVRASAALFLGHGEIMDGQEALIRHLLTDPTDTVRTMCVTSLDHMADNPQKLAALLACLHDTQYQVVYPACRMLGLIGDPVAIQPLRRILDHSSWDVRFRACEALVRLGAVDKQVVSLSEELDQAIEAEWHNRMVEQIRRDVAPDHTQSKDEPSKSHTTQELLRIARSAMQ